MSELFSQDFKNLSAQEQQLLIDKIKSLKQDFPTKQKKSFEQMECSKAESQQMHMQNPEHEHEHEQFQGAKHKYLIPEGGMPIDITNCKDMPIGCFTILDQEDLKQHFQTQDQQQKSANHQMNMESKLTQLTETSHEENKDISPGLTEDISPGLTEDIENPQHEIDLENEQKIKIQQDLIQPIKQTEEDQEEWNYVLKQFERGIQRETQDQIQRASSDRFAQEQVDQSVQDQDLIRRFDQEKRDQQIKSVNFQEQKDKEKSQGISTEQKEQLENQDIAKQLDKRQAREQQEEFPKSDIYLSPQQFLQEQKISRQQTDQLSTQSTMGGDQSYMRDLTQLNQLDMEQEDLMSLQQRNKAVMIKGNQICLQDYRESLSPCPGEVLIRVLYASCNPFDKLLLQKQMCSEGFPFGSEGCGIIERVGSDINPDLIGTTVSFLQKAWSKYCIQPLRMCMIWSRKIDSKTGAMAMLNPLNILGLLDIIKQKGIKYVMQTGASSHVSYMFNKMSQKEGIQVINLVKNDASIKRLRHDTGAKYILQQDDFDAIDKIIEKLQPEILIDYQGGELTGLLFKKMPKSSELILAGNLSQEHVPIYTMEMFFNQKTVRGFLMHTWLDKCISDEKRWFEIYGCVRKDLIHGGKIFGQRVARVYNLEDWETAINEFEELAQEGKCLIKCNDYNVQNKDKVL